MERRVVNKDFLLSHPRSPFSLFPAPPSPRLLPASVLPQPLFHQDTYDTTIMTDLSPSLQQGAL